ncbi:hypothetical protein Rsub_02501 [Raphidocelis subcapitata]|uniref:CARDB domain-containing protein n=1 Tax=Raphidocelis subcapitata TaxID=307507 RepID=A0A2V0NZZ0_9CHLO|nr:hypothetical protein Rsub_02501 [Raphidocelis subcapitata]|eukprot:GBF90395.1 hypothetical protein Rsub_02501 [Raphidocelis subcapitata]
MAALRAVGALLAVAAVALAAPACAQLPGPDGAPAFISNLPADDAPRVLEDSGANPITFWSSLFVPLNPEVGGKRKFTLYIANKGGVPIAKGTVVSLWANRTTYAACGETAGADAEYTLPEIAPYQTATLKVKVPYTSDSITANDTATMILFIDSKCTAYNESAQDNQRPANAYVVPKNSEYTSLFVASATPNDYPYGLSFGRVFNKNVPSVGSTFSSQVTVQSTGNAPTPKGVKVQVWPSTNFDIDISSCNNSGGVTIELPKLGPGKTKTLTVDSLVAPDAPDSYLLFLTDAGCALNSKPGPLRFGYYDIAPSASAYFGGVQAKGQLSYTVKTAPKAPKVNDTMTVSIKLQNWGSVEGAIGKVGVWLTPAADWPAPTDGGFWGGELCAYTGYVATADFSDVVVKPGKSKTVKIKDVPVPVAPGWWQVSAVPDINCTLPASSAVRLGASYTAFEVVA